MLQPPGCSRALLIADISPATSQFVTHFGNVDVTHHQPVSHGSGGGHTSGLAGGHRRWNVDRATARRELGIPEDAQAIVSVGSLVPVKSHGLLVLAMAELAKRNPKLRLYIVGEGQLRTKLAALIHEQNLRECVFLAGGQPNETLKLWYSAADVSCLASSREGMPNVVLESLACGTPVVATRVGGVGEVLVSENLGILVEPSAEGITAGLERALQQQWDRDSIACHANARTWDVVAEEVEKYFVVRRGLTKSEMLTS